MCVPTDAINHSSPVTIADFRSDITLAEYTPLCIDWVIVLTLLIFYAYITALARQDVLDIEEHVCVAYAGLLYWRKKLITLFACRL